MRRRPARGQLGEGGRGDHDDRYGAESPVAARAAWGGRSDRHRDREGLGHDPPRHGDVARVRRDGRPGRSRCAAPAPRRRRGALVQPHQRGRRYVHQRFLRPHCNRRERRDDDRRPEPSRIRAVAGSGARGSAGARAGDRARRRRRDQIHHGPRGKRPDRNRMCERRLFDRALAAREDRVFCIRSESGAAARRDRQRRRARSRSRPRRALPRRGAGVERWRPRSGLPRGGREARHGKKRDHGSRRAHDYVTINAQYRT